MASNAAMRAACGWKPPEALLFARSSKALDEHALRQESAQTLYVRLSVRALPPATGRLRRGVYDAAAALEVSRQ